MTITNLSDINATGTAVMQNGDFLTFDALPNNKFSLFIPTLPNVQFFLQSFSLPGVVVNQVPVATRYVDYAGVGEKLNFDPFEVTFLVDKYCRNFTSIFDWMKKMSVDGSSVDFSDDLTLFADGKEFIRFIDAWPTSLSGLDLSATTPDMNYVVGRVSFNYDYFNIISEFATVDSSYA